ncbi:MAG: GAF domain-containing protein [Salinivirgaceae bacterium]|nr:GAF domain-containing protein [Salinivirgaceae bacterium]MBR4620814.1 GAF domain-containing protein [Salinivirgaceae bacterium]
MNSVLLFALIVIFGIVPFGIAFLRIIYKKTIVFKIGLVIFLPSMFCTIVAYAVGYYGLWSLIWAVPLCFAVLMLSNVATKKYFQRPIVRLREKIDEMGRGVFAASKSETKHKQDEIGDIYRSFKNLAVNLHNTALFADAIANNNFEHEYQMASEDDELGKALTNMRDELKKAKAAEKQQAAEQEKEAWTANGIAIFNDLLRQETSNLEAMSRTFISKLTDYIGVVQGGVFIINNDDPEHVKYELKGAVAYNRVKHNEKEFEVGIGLVGQCAYEKAPIYLNEIPDNYMEITSGLGEANPKYILLMPAIMNDTVYAVIELASFSKIDDYKVNFLTKISDALSSTISMVKINASTAKLLEESKDKADMLAEQSEVLKQSFEELRATQEDLARKEAKLRELEQRYNIQREEDEDE